MTDPEFLESVARRLADALYYGTLKPIGINGSVSTGLRHDDYDRLRSLAKEMRGESRQLAHEIGRATLPWEAPSSDG